MSKRPSRIDLLELDIDLRLADLWREASEIGEWNLDVVAAFMRAAYGKGYCDALMKQGRPSPNCGRPSLRKLVGHDDGIRARGEDDGRAVQRPVHREAEHVLTVWLASVV